MHFHALIAFVGLKNVGYGFVKTIYESIHRNVSLMLKLSKKGVIIRNVGILVEKIDMGRTALSATLIDVLQRMLAAFERAVHYETDVVIEAVFENAVHDLAHALLEFCRVVAIVAFEQIPIRVDVDKKESPFLGIQHRFYEFGFSASWGSCHENGGDGLPLGF